jgi:hypothetical protein
MIFDNLTELQNADIAITKFVLQAIVELFDNPFPYGIGKSARGKIVPAD